MLKYRINKDNVINDEDKIIINDCKIINLDIYNRDSYLTLNSILCTTNKLENVKVGTTLLTYHTIPTSFNDYGKNVYEYTKKYTIQEIDELNSSFIFSDYKYLELPLQYINKVENYRNDESEIVKDEYLYIYFDEPHFFSSYEDDVNIDGIDSNEEENTTEGIIQYVWALYDEQLIRMQGFEVMTNTAIRFKWEDIVNKYSFISNDVIDENSLFGDITRIRFFRENYFFTYIDNFEIYYNIPRCTIPIGITSKFQTGLLKEQAIEDYFNEAKRNSINGVMDMEKDVYYPYCRIEGEYKPIIKIKFNLHFRERNNDAWTTETDSNWNGTYVDENDEIQFIDEFFSYEVKENQSDLLSYLNFTDGDVRYQKNRLKKSFLRLSFYDSMNEGNQNLLSYSSIFMDVGKYFNKYIRFLEEKPYKSIEQSVKTEEEKGEVDEDNENEENDSNEEPYSVIYDLKGLRVNREPDNVLILNKDEDEIEEHRLSTQLVITDKYNSTASSEGFYLYLWKDILNNFTEEERKNGINLFMKVEFNHAGYGRKVPFMMPYWDNQKWNGETRNWVKYTEKEGIKTFKEIIADWNSTMVNLIDKDKDERKNFVSSYWENVVINKDEEKVETKEEQISDNKTYEPEIDGKYGARQYNKFSYIRFKITYDEKEKKYIYFLDDNCYGKKGITKSYDEETATLTLNLYEAKMA